MEKYRKLTPNELKNLGIVIDDDRYKIHNAFARKYYPANATSMVLVVDSEYNDSTYDNTLKYVIVYDKDGNELPPLKETAAECRSKWHFDNLPVTLFTGHYNETSERVDDIVIPLNQNLPDLYVKVE